MKSYTVYVPIAGYMVVDVEAESEEEAEDVGFDKAYEILGGVELPTEVSELEAYEKLMQGNFCYVWKTEIEVEEND